MKNTDAKVILGFKMIKYYVLQAKNSSHSLFFILFKGCVTEYLRKFPLTNFQTYITYQPN